MLELGALALRFVILTAARTGEVRGMTWDEVDMDAKLWTVPGERMKAGEEHVVPLSKAALAILKPLKALGRDGLVFEGIKRGKPLSDMTLTAVLKRLEIDDATVHGFRSSFRDWCSDTGKDRELAERALAHVLRNQTERAYARSTMLDRRRQLMDEWAEYCGG